MKVATSRQHEWKILWNGERSKISSFGSTCEPPELGMSVKAQTGLADTLRPHLAPRRPRDGNRPYYAKSIAGIGLWVIPAFKPGISHSWNQCVTSLPCPALCRSEIFSNTLCRGNGAVLSDFSSLIDILDTKNPWDPRLAIPAPRFLHSRGTGLMGFNSSAPVFRDSNKDQSSLFELLGLSGHASHVQSLLIARKYFLAAVHTAKLFPHCGFLIEDEDFTGLRITRPLSAAEFQGSI